MTVLSALRIKQCMHHLHQSTQVIAPLALEKQFGWRRCETTFAFWTIISCCLTILTVTFSQIVLNFAYLINLRGAIYVFTFLFGLKQHTTGPRNALSFLSFSPSHLISVKVLLTLRNLYIKLKKTN